MKPRIISYLIVSQNQVLLSHKGYQEQQPQGQWKLCISIFERRNVANIKADISS